MGLLFTGCFARQAAMPILNPHHQDHIVTLIEYYDDKCPHCHKMGAVIEQLKIVYPNLHIVYRATPILSNESWVIASLVEAAGKQKAALLLLRAFLWY
jgi:protein-disulfide isomerase